MGAAWSTPVKDKTYDIGTSFVRSFAFQPRIMLIFPHFSHLHLWTRKVTLIGWEWVLECDLEVWV